MTKHRVAVFGASGYTGGELLRYLASHPGLEVAWATADANAGRLVAEVHPQLAGHVLGEVRLAGAEDDPPPVELAFLALPHGTSAALGRKLAAGGVRVVDIAADWRLRDAEAYAQWYGWTHPAPAELSDWVYGLTELHRQSVQGAAAVANPGCYPTAAVLALAPLLGAGAVEPDGIIVSAASGVSGAGRKVDAAYLFTELEGSFAAYGVGSHRHTPEIDQELSGAAGGPVAVTFTPHLAPMTRGILATCFARTDADAPVLRDCLRTAYKGEQFVRVLDAGAQPATKHVYGTNLAHLAVETDARTGTAVVTCAIDNLGKGAAGQAVQNANLMLGLDEAAGLGATAVFP